MSLLSIVAIALLTSRTVCVRIHVTNKDVRKWPGYDECAIEGEYCKANGGGATMYYGTANPGLFTWIAGSIGPV